MGISYQKIESPIGKLYLVADRRRLLAVVFQKNWLEFKKKFTDISESDNPLLIKAKKQLSEYFRGERKKFDLPYQLNGTAFQNRVWKSLSKIPFGKTKSYKEQAFAIRNPKAVRAVGQTNGLNPLSIILPCHRVIGSSGKLVGYGGGLKIKKLLLDLETGYIEK